MPTTNYQRFIIGYHGCCETVVEKVLKDGSELEHSKNDYDWLGRGTYFWEYAPDRALEWAKHSKKINGKIDKPSVIGAYINLGNCFDLLDIRNTIALQNLFPRFCEFCKKSGKAIPENKAARKDTSDELVLRYLDCAMINWYIDLAAKVTPFQTVRCAFVEGEPAFPGSKIRLKTHVEIAVIDKSCILGYFRPRVHTIIA
jgi:hypothetical protein